MHRCDEFNQYLRQITSTREVIFQLISNIQTDIMNQDKDVRFIGKFQKDIRVVAVMGKLTSMLLKIITMEKKLREEAENISEPDKKALLTDLEIIDQYVARRLGGQVINIE